MPKKIKVHKFIDGSVWSWTRKKWMAECAIEHLLTALRFTTNYSLRILKEANFAVCLVYAIHEYREYRNDIFKVQVHAFWGLMLLLLFLCIQNMISSPRNRPKFIMIFRRKCDSPEIEYFSNRCKSFLHIEILIVLLNLGTVFKILSKSFFCLIFRVTLVLWLLIFRVRSFPANLWDMRSLWVSGL